jgi:DNA (cytosine-5)-methyltransferase 1
MSSNSKIYKLGELFCGPGGFAEGANKTKLFKHVWANDIDERACETFKLHHPECKVIPGDVNKIFLKKEAKNLEKIDGLLFGFPCNDFSLVGKKTKLEGDFGGLYKAAVKTLKYFQPKFFIAENVTAISPINKKDENSEVYKNFLKIMSDLASASDYGYKIYADRFKFEEYGVPQSRHRMILVGYKGDFFEKNKVNYIKPKKLFESANDFITCKTALEEGVPGTKQSPLSLKKAANQELTKHSKDVLLRLENTKEGQNVWDLEDKFGLPGVTKARMSHIYKKLDSTRPSYTVTGSGGGGTHVYHYKENRALTNRERARLQTFDDSYEFKGSKEEVRKQIGMAVPVLAAKHILKAVYKSLKKNKESVKSHHDWMIDPFGKTLNFTGQAKLNNENQMDFNF